MQKCTTMSLVYSTRGEWHNARAYHYQASSTTTYDMCALAYYHDSSMYHLRQVTYMQKHITTSLVRATHGERHVCKNTVSKPRLDNSLVNPPKGSTNPRSALGESYWFTPCLQYLLLRKRRICKRKPFCLQYIPPIVSDMSARAQYLQCTQDSSNPSFALADPYRSTKSKARPW